MDSVNEAPPPPGLVTIGIPTRDRARLLKRALATALAQDYAPLEVVISDNASSDDTARLCTEEAERDNRVRYVRQDRDQGAVGNFEAVLRAARGEYFMWLADDDWLDIDYVSCCTRVLQDDPAVQLVAGRAWYYEGDEHVLDAEAIDVVDGEPGQRMLAFYRQSRTNSTFYGVARTSVLREVLPLRRCFGSDWLIAAFLAYRGGVRTLPETTLHRSLGGMSFESDVVRQMGLGPVAARAPFAWLTMAIGIDLLCSKQYGEMNRRRRLSLAFRCHLVGVRRLLLGRKLARFRPRMAALARRVLPGCAYRWTRHRYLTSTGKLPSRPARP